MEEERICHPAEQVIWSQLAKRSPTNKKGWFHEKSSFLVETTGLKPVTSCVWRCVRGGKNGLSRPFRPFWLKISCCPLRWFHCFQTAPIPVWVSVWVNVSTRNTAKKRAASYGRAIFTGIRKNRIHFKSRHICEPGRLENLKQSGYYTAICAIGHRLPKIFFRT